VALSIRVVSFFGLEWLGSAAYWRYASSVADVPVRYGMLCVAGHRRQGHRRREARPGSPTGARSARAATLGRSAATG